jgi:SAM-dependent methyltransferase
MRVLYGRHYEARYRSLAALIPEHASVLELCCGTGELYRRHLSSKAIRYVGLDLNPEFIRRVRAAGADAREADVRSCSRFPSADYVLMQASLYQFMPEATVIIARMLAAARDRVIVAEPIHNLSASTGPLGPWLARMANPGDGDALERYDEETLTRLLNRFRPRIERTFLLPGGRERVYVLNAQGAM